MTLDHAITSYVNELKGNDGRSTAIKEQASERYAKAEAKAKAAYDRAIRSADEDLREAIAATETANAQITVKAAAKFDAAARAAVGAPDDAEVRTSGNRLELWIGSGRAPLAVAEYTGPAGWHLDGPGGRSFLGPAGQAAARAGLWRIAASLPMPVR